MKTATTLHRTAKGWVLKYGPETPFGKQKAEFSAAVSGHWPKDVTAVRFQASEGKAKVIDSTKAEVRAKARAQAEIHAEGKLLRQKRDAQAARLRDLIAELTPRVSHQKERVDVFKSKCDASAGTKFNDAFAIEHKQAQALLEELEKKLAGLKAELDGLKPSEPKPQSPKSKV